MEEQNQENQVNDEPQKDTSAAQPVDASPESSSSQVPPSEAPATPAHEEADAASGQADEVDGSQDQQQDPSSSSPGDGSEQQS